MLLIIALCLSIVGCGNETADNRGTSEESVEIAGTYEEEIVEKRDAYLYKQGKSDYVILLSANATQSDIYALDELVYFFKESTGYTLKTVYEPQAISASQRYISIGNTTKLTAHGVKENTDDYGRSGFKIVTKDENIYIFSNGDAYSYGTLYGTYYFLERVLGYKCYASDEIKIDKKNIVNFYEFDAKILPAIDIRSLNFGSITSDSTYRNRMRLIKRFNTDEWAINGHATFTILPPKTYYADHPDWYSPAGDQLCYTNEEMKAEFIKNIKEFIIADPAAIYVSIAQEDHNTFCNCDKCRAKVEEYGGADKGGEAGVIIAFGNDVAEAIEIWLKENYPARHIQLVTYAYHKTTTAPVRYDEQTGKYIPTHKDVVPRENLSVMFCPISQDYFYGINAAQNKASAEAFQKWYAICDHMMVYEYSTNFINYLINFNNFDTIEDRIRFYAQNDLDFYFEQTSWGTNTPCFDALRIFVTSQLLYNPSLNFNDLKDEFFQNYYKQAADAMNEYFYALRAVYRDLQDRDMVRGGIYAKLLDSSYWEFGTLLSFEKIFDKAFKAIESVKGDAALYDALWNRINREKLSTTYLLCALYKPNFSTEEYNAMVKALEYYGGKYGFIYSREGGSYSSVIEELKK